MMRKKSCFSNDCLWKHHLFAERDPRFVELLGRDVKVEVFRPGEIIFKEGAKGSSMYVLRRGEVEIICGGVVVAKLGSGSIFGEILLLGVSDRRTATVQATEFSDCRVVQRTYLQRLLRLFPREKAFFEQVARQRMIELKAVAPSATPSRSGTKEGVADEGVAREEKQSNDAAIMMDFSRFFEKPVPSWRQGKLKKGALPEMSPRNHGDDLIAICHDHPVLPPLLTRRDVAVGRSMEQARNDATAIGQDCTGVFIHPLSPVKDGKGESGGDPSFRSPSTRTPSPRKVKTLSMYESALVSSPPGFWKPRHTESRNRIIELCTPRLLDLE